MGSNARDHASLRRHDVEERHTVVFSGFPAKSRLAGHADVLDLGDKVFAPSIRTNIAMIRLPNKTALFKFVNAWKQAEGAGLISKFGDDKLVIRAKRHKPPAIRKTHVKLWQLLSQLKNLGHNDTEIDWRNCSL